MFQYQINIYNIILSIFYYINGYFSENTKENTNIYFDYNKFIFLLVILYVNCYYSNICNINNINNIKYYVKKE